MLPHDRGSLTKHATRVLLALALFAAAPSACKGTDPNPQAGYVLKISLGAGITATTVTALRVVLDSFPFGPRLGLLAGPGEAFMQGAVSVTSRRTDIDGDAEVEMVFEANGNPFAAGTTFDLPLRSPGYKTVPFLVRVDVLGAGGVLGTATAGTTAQGKPLDFDLGDSLDVPVTVPCTNATLCAASGADGGAGDGGLTLDAGTDDAGVADAGTGDGGAALPLPTATLAFARASTEGGDEDTLSLYAPRTGTTTPLSTGALVDAFRFSPDGNTLYVVRHAAGGTPELVSIAATGGAPAAITQGPELSGLTLAAAGTRVAVRMATDGGASWLVRATDGDGGIDVLSLTSGALDFSPSGTDVAVAVPQGGGVSLALTTADVLDLRVLAAMRTLTSLVYSPLGAHVAVVGTRAGETKASVYVASVFGDPLVRLSPDPLAGEVRDVAFSPDGQKVAFRADLNTAGAVELFVASPGLRSVSGGVAPDGGGVGQWRFHPVDSSKLAFLSDRREPGVKELYQASTGGAVPRRLSQDGVDGGSAAVSDFAFGRTGARLAYRTALGRLHVVRDPAAAPLDLGDADAFAISPDEAFAAVVRAGALFLVSLDGAQTVGPIATGLRDKRISWRPLP